MISILVKDNMTNIEAQGNTSDLVEEMMIANLTLLHQMSRNDARRFSRLKGEVMYLFAAMQYDEINKILEKDIGNPFDLKGTGRI